jgi:hypothetical protein
VVTSCLHLGLGTSKGCRFHAPTAALRCRRCSSLCGSHWSPTGSRWRATTAALQDGHQMQPPLRPRHPFGSHWRTPIGASRGDQSPWPWRTSTCPTGSRWRVPIGEPQAGQLLLRPNGRMNQEFKLADMCSEERGWRRCTGHRPVGHKRVAAKGSGALQGAQGLGHTQIRVVEVEATQVAAARCRRRAGSSTVGRACISGHVVVGLDGVLTDEREHAILLALVATRPNTVNAVVRPTLPGQRCRGPRFPVAHPTTTTRHHYQAGPPPGALMRSHPNGAAPYETREGPVSRGPLLYPERVGSRNSPQASSSELWCCKAHLLLCASARVGTLCPFGPMQTSPKMEPA